MSYAGVSAEYVFIVPTWDADTREVIRGCKPTAEILDSKEPQRNDVRVWNSSRFEHMASLRNRVLSVIREVQPDWFWSLDSDIEPREDALAIALEDNAARSEPFSAVGMRCLMEAWPGRTPSYGFFRGEGLTGRIDQEGFFAVDCIMAAKLLSQPAYEVDYRPGGTWGEDVGWSFACKEAGVTLGWDSRSVCKHVMDPLLLDKFDPRVGW